MSLNPTSLNIVQGNSGTMVVSTATLAGAPQSITLSLVSAVPPPPQGLDFTASSGVSPQPSQPAWVGQLPPGVTYSFSPQTITSGGSSTLTINVAAGTPIGTYLLEVLATGVVTRVDQFNLQVSVGVAAQDFSV